MQIRNVELKTLFSEKMERICNIQNIQGYFYDQNKNTFNGIFEAATISNIEEEFRFRLLPFSFAEFHNKAVLAKALGCDFYFFLYKEYSHSVRIYKITASQEQHYEYKFECEYPEHDFLEFWKQKKNVKNKKSYIHGLAKRIDKSPFDMMLEKNGQQWGGNLDGFIIKNDRILGIIEERYTEKKALRMYDPADYFSDDLYSWKYLFAIKTKLNVPFFLLTFSKNKHNYEESNLVGITEIESIDNNKLTYKTTNDIENMKPFENIFSNVLDARDYIWKEIEAFYKNN